MLAILLFLSSLGMTLLVSQQLQTAHDELNTIAIKSVPSVDAAQRLLELVQDVDAKAADYVAAAAITDTHPCHISGTNQVVPNQTYQECDARNIDAELVLADKELYQAIRNARYPGEQTALDRIAAGLDEYKADIMISRHEYELAGTNFDPTNVHLINAKNAYYDAKNVLSVQITGKPVPDPNDEKSSDIPPCTLNVRTSSSITSSTLSAQAWPGGSLEENVACLTSINKQHLDDAYNQAVAHLDLTLAIISIASIAFCALLIFTIWRVTRVTHYVVHFTLLLVTLTSIVFSILAVTEVTSLSGQQGTFKVMVTVKYDTLYYSSLIQEYVTAANADESRWLIAATFNDQKQILQWQNDWEFNKATVIGLILQVEDNHTGSAQDKPLADMLQHWKNYINIDPQIRAKASDIYLPLYNRIKNAQTLRLSNSNEEFLAVLDAVSHLDIINRSDMNSAYSKANNFLTIYVPLCFVLFPLVGILAGGSLLRRTRDF